MKSDKIAVCFVTSKIFLFKTHQLFKMKNTLWILLLVVMTLPNLLQAQDKKEDPDGWKVGGALGLDFSQLLFINPKVGAGENRIGIGGNTAFFANLKNGRLRWENKASLAFGVQRLGNGDKVPFQKSVDELRISSDFSYGITDSSHFGYSLTGLLVSQITPTYQGNFLTRQDPTGPYHPIAKFMAPATLTISPGISYHKKTKIGEFKAQLSPASIKAIMVLDDSIARLGLHGNPYSEGVTEEEFVDNWRVRPTGTLGSSVAPIGYYSSTYLQFGASFTAGYKGKFFEYQDGKKKNHRLLVGTTINLYSNYLRQPQNIDVEWITNVDIIIFKGLSVSLMTNLFYDHDIMVQVDRNNDLSKGVDGDGYESTGRRVSFMQQLLIKYNFLF